MQAFSDEDDEEDDDDAESIKASIMLVTAQYSRNLPRVSAPRCSAHQAVQRVSPSTLLLHLAQPNAGTCSHCGPRPELPKLGHREIYIQTEKWARRSHLRILAWVQGTRLLAQEPRSSSISRLTLLVRRHQLHQLTQPRRPLRLSEIPLLQLSLLLVRSAMIGSSRSNRHYLWPMDRDKGTLHATAAPRKLVGRF